MIRRFFDSFSLRERFLLVSFIWLGLLFWMTVLLQKYRAQHFEFSKARQTLVDQQVFLDNRELIEEREQQARAGIDPSRTYAGSALFSTVDNLARAADMTPDIQSPLRREAGIFNTNTVRVSVRRVTLEQLVTFVQSVRAEAPYLALRRFQLDANARDPNQLNASFEIESFELAESYF